MRSHISVARIATVTVFAATVSVPAQTNRSGNADTAVRFEVASIKLNTSGQFGSGPPVRPNGEVRFVNVRLRTMLAFAYPDLTLPVEVLGVPSCAEPDRYDVIAKGKPGATSAN